MPDTDHPALLAYALVLQQDAAGPGWHAVLVTPLGETHAFPTLAALLRFLVDSSVGTPPQPGLR